MQQYERGIKALESIVKSRNVFKKTIDALVKEEEDVTDQKKRLEMIIGDGDLQAEIEKVIGRIKYLEQEKQHIETNYWQMNKALLVLAVAAGIGANVGFWFLMRYFLNRDEEIGRIEGANRRRMSNLGFVAREVFNANNQV